MDFSKLFDKEALIQRIKEQGKALTKLVVSELINEFLKLLNIPKVRNSVRIQLLLYHLLKYFRLRMHLFSQKLAYNFYIFHPLNFNVLKFYLGNTA